jgi:hypothetical protein
MTSQTSSERARDKTLEDTFPASDPPANSGITGAESSETSSEDGAAEPKPTGTPTSDRHATETAHQSEDEVKPSN